MAMDDGRNISVPFLKTMSSNGPDTRSNNLKRQWDRILLDMKQVTGDSLPIQQRKRTKLTQDDAFTSYMTDDTFLLLLRFFVSNSGLVDGESVRSIMLVSKQWYKACNSPTLWNLPKDAKHPIPLRPSPLIRENVSSLSSVLIGFANFEAHKTDDGRPSFTVRERATGKLFLIDILDAADSSVIQSAASAHYLIGDKFLNEQSDDSVLFLPIGMESSNGKVVRWFPHSDSLHDFLLTQRENGLTESNSCTQTIKEWSRNLLEAVKQIHGKDAVHGCISPHNIYLDSSPEAKTKMKLACPSLFPVTSYQPNEYLKYASPELLISLSVRRRMEPTPKQDIWAIGCVIAEIIRRGSPLFGPYPSHLRDDRSHDAVLKYARNVCRIVGSPPSCSTAPRSQEPIEFPLDCTISDNLKKYLPGLDASGIDLMKKLLCPDPEKRPTAKEALAHYPGDLPIQRIDTECIRTRLEPLSRLVFRESQSQPLSPTRSHARLNVWATLVDYVLEIVEVFDLETAAAYRAMSYADRFFSSYQRLDTFSSRKYQLIVGTCLYVASKLDEIELSKSDIAFSADNIFDDTDIAIAQEAILNELGWKLFFPTIYDFVKLACNCLNLDTGSRPRQMSYYIAELALQSQVYLAFRPSLVASCVVALAHYCVGAADPYPETFAEAMGYSWNDLELCMVALTSDIHTIRATLPLLKIIPRRYKKAQKGRVGLVHIPRITSISTMRHPGVQP